MATKEDILEQLIEEFLIHQGYFVRHNVKYLPSKHHADYVQNQDSNHSDIDVLGYNPLASGCDRVWAVSCKSWQFGFNPTKELSYIEQNKTVRGKPAWKAFREVTSDKWAEGFRQAIFRATGEQQFTCVLAVAKLTGDKSIWERHSRFIERLCGNPIKIITFSEVIGTIYPHLNTTLASSEVGRMLQMFKASGIKLSILD